MSQDWLSPAEREKFLGYLAERFGIPTERFEGFALYRKGEYINVLSEAAAGAAEEFDATDAGLQLAKITHSGSVKPVTRGFQIFGDAAVRNVVDLDSAGLKAMIEGRRVDAPGLQGFVILRHGGRPVGVGLCREGRLESQLPRNMTEHLLLPAQAEMV